MLNEKQAIMMLCNVMHTAAKSVVYPPCYMQQGGKQIVVLYTGKLREKSHETVIAKKYHGIIVVYWYTSKLVRE